MTVALPSAPARRWPLFWPGLVLVTLVLSQFGGDLAKGLGHVVGSGCFCWCRL